MTRVLLLLRHGESTANADDVFGGWLDYPLTNRGRDQAAAAGRLIRDAGLDTGRPAHVAAHPRHRHRRRSLWPRLIRMD